MSDSQNPTELEQTKAAFIEETGLKAQNDGMPRTAGRLFGLLIWTGEQISFSSLSEQLQVSRGSISTASRVLEDRGLIKRTTKPGERQDYFQLGDTPYLTMMGTVKRDLLKTKEQIKATYEKVPDDQPEIRARLAEYASFYERLSHAVEGLIEEIS